MLHLTSFFQNVSQLRPLNRAYMNRLSRNYSVVYDRSSNRYDFHYTRNGTETDDDEEEERVAGYFGCFRDKNADRRDAVAAGSAAVRRLGSTKTASTATNLALSKTDPSAATTEQHDGYWGLFKEAHLNNSSFNLSQLYGEQHHDQPSNHVAVATATSSTTSLVREQIDTPQLHKPHLPLRRQHTKSESCENSSVQGDVSSSQSTLHRRSAAVNVVSSTPPTPTRSSALHIGGDGGGRVDLDVESSSLNSLATSLASLASLSSSRKLVYDYKQRACKVKIEASKRDKMKIIMQNLEDREAQLRRETVRSFRLGSGSYTNANSPATNNMSSNNSRSISSSSRNNISRSRSVNVDAHIETTRAKTIHFLHFANKCDDLLRLADQYRQQKQKPQLLNALLSAAVNVSESGESGTGRAASTNSNINAANLTNFKNAFTTLSKLKKSVNIFNGNYFNVDSRSLDHFASFINVHASLSDLSGLLLGYLQQQQQPSRLKSSTISLCSNLFELSNRSSRRPSGDDSDTMQLPRPLCSRDASGAGGSGGLSGNSNNSSCESSSGEEAVALRYPLDSWQHSSLSEKDDGIGGSLPFGPHNHSTMLYEHSGVKIGFIALVDRPVCERLAVYLAQCAGSECGAGRVEYVDYVAEADRLARQLRLSGAHLIVALVSMESEQSVMRLVNEADDLNLVFSSQQAKQQQQQMTMTADNFDDDHDAKEAATAAAALSAAAAHVHVTGKSGASERWLIRSGNNFESLSLVSVKLNELSAHDILDVAITRYYVD